MLLAGDVGGTKTQLVVFSPQDGPRMGVASEVLPSGDYGSLEALVSRFLARHDLEIEEAVFGVAGPVVGGRAEITNLPWVMEEEGLRRALAVRTVRLLNDVEAIAHAVPHLQPGDVHTLNEGEPAPGGAIAVVAPGTGLGEAYLAWDGARYRANATEGGHAGFAPESPLETDLLRHLQDRFGHVSCERVCSGLGIPNIYGFLKASGVVGEEPGWLREQLAEAGDPTPVIVGAALDANRSCDLCVATLDTFVSILGAEAGNVALRVLATGGVYLAGGIPPRILSALEKGLFLEAFRRKGRMRDLMARMPVHVIVGSGVALLGAAYHAMEDRGRGAGEKG
jgi:glucokinase